MTPLILQNKVKEELELFLEKFNIYEQSLPPRKGKDDSHFPYALIELGNGEENDEEATQEIVITFGVKDEVEDYSGYTGIVNVVQEVRQHMLSKKIIGEMFEVKKPIKWVLPESNETYPKYFGGILLTFSIPLVVYNNENM